MRAAGTIAVALLATLTLAGCGRSKEEAPPPPVSEAPSIPAPPAAQPFAVTGVTLGKAVGADKKVAAATDTFAPADTIYASVDTQGAAPTAALTAKWTYQDGQTVHEETQTLAPTGPATTEFHVSKPDGWPKGSYTVEILLDGISAQRASFRVL
jgi:ABC-type Fe3+-hydroxamate transport system substrate-binding protein